MSSSRYLRALAAGLATTVALTAGTTTAVWAAGPSPLAAAAAAGAAIADPTNTATDEDKVKAAGALGISPGIDLLVLNDQDFVYAIWERSDPIRYSFVKAEALRTYLSSDSQDAYTFITAGIFTAVADDNLAEIARESDRALRRSVAVTAGLDPSDTALIELGDRDFIFALWQRVSTETDVHLKAAAQAAIVEGTDQDDWTTFLTTAAAAAHEQDVQDALDKADEAEKARIAAAELVNAKKSLLQLLLLPVTDELVNAPNRQYVLQIHASAKGTEVVLAAQAALNAADADLAKALKDFIFTGGAAANKKDEDAAAAKELAGYKTKVTAIRDAAKRDGLETNLVAAADKALTTGTLLSVQTFLLKGQDEARTLDRKARVTVQLTGTRIGVLSTDGALYLREGALGSTGWSTMSGGVKQFAMAGTRIGIVTTDGTAYVKDGATTALWSKMLDGVKQIVLTSNRVGVVTYDGTAYVKEGALNTAWTKEYVGVKQLVLDGTRIGMITTSGTAIAKDGGLSAGWDEQNTSAKVKFLALSGSRVGVITEAGTAFVKEGALSTTSWVQQYATINGLALSANRVAVLQLPNSSVPENPLPPETDRAGRAYVKDGTLASTTWTTERSDSRRLAISGTRIGTILDTGAVLVKDGGLSASWTTVRTVENF